MPVQGSLRHHHRFSTSTAALALLLAVPLADVFTSVAARPGIAFATVTTASLSSSTSSSSLSSSLSSSIFAPSPTVNATTTSISATPTYVAAAATTTTTVVTPSSSELPFPASTPSTADLLSGLGLAGLLHLRQEPSEAADEASQGTSMSSATTAASPSASQALASSYPDNIYFDREGYITATETVSTAIESSTSAAPTAIVEAFDDSDPPLLQPATSAASSNTATSLKSSSVALPTVLPSDAALQQSPQSRVISNHRARSVTDDTHDDDDDDDDDCEEDDDEEEEDGDEGIATDDGSEDRPPVHHGIDRTATLGADDPAAAAAAETGSQIPPTMPAEPTASFPVEPEPNSNATIDAPAVEAELQELQKSLTLLQTKQQKGDTSPAAVRRAMQNVQSIVEKITQLQRRGTFHNVGRHHAEHHLAGDRKQKQSKKHSSSRRLNARDKLPDVGKHHDEFEKQQPSHKFPDIKKHHAQSQHSRDFRVFSRSAPEHDAHPGVKATTTTTTAMTAPPAGAMQQQQKAQELALVTALDDWELISAWFKEHLPVNLHAKIHEALHMPTQ